MKLTSILAISQDRFWQRVWGYWRSPGMMKINNLWSDRKEQQFRSFLMAQRGRGKSRAKTAHEILLEPKYTIKWVKKSDSAAEIKK